MSHNKRKRALPAIIAVLVLGICEAQGSDGDLDPTFGNGGLVRTVENGLGEAQDVAVQSDGKIVVVAPKNNQFAVRRYNTGGTPDASFGTNGEVNINLGLLSKGAPYAVAIQVNDKILVGGTVASSIPIRGVSPDFVLVRLNASGTLDTTFGDLGLIRTDFSGGNDVVNDLVIQPDGKIVAVGQAGVGDNIKFGVARYTSKGALDLSFAGDGKKTIGWGDGYNVAYRVALQTDGKIVVGGDTQIDVGNGFPQNFMALARITPSGPLDASFGSNGQETIPFYYSTGTLLESSLRGIAVQPDGQIIAAGSTTSFVNLFEVVRLNIADGSLDATWGNLGRVQTGPLKGYATLQRAVTLDNNKIIVGGYVLNTDLCGLSFKDIALIRYEGNGVLDTGFGASGKVDYNPYTTGCTAGISSNSFVLQTDHKIVAVGGDQDGNGPGLTLVRFQNATSTLTGP